MDFSKIENEKSILRILAVILGLLLIVLTLSIAVDTLNKIKEGKYIGQEIENRTTISVSGTGEIFAIPDLAIVDFAVVTEAKTAEASLASNSVKMNAVIESMKKQGIDEKDIKTTGFSIYPRYEYQKQSIGGYYYPPEGVRTLVGYEVQQSLNVKIRNLSDVGRIIEGATTAGANEVNSLQFTIENEDDLKIQAREEAIKEAKTAANKLADELGVKLVKIVSFNENSYLPYFSDMKEAYGYGGGTMPASAPEIEPGQNKISSTVNIVYEIN
ncbi:MAG: SIMPL domain-containing protein [Candidatus Parcubacteria bacterium]|nr:SIMPL domain-containing protein [Candidatus Parcubacteria bacterium]